MAMTNLEKYDYAFMTNFRASKEELPSLKYEGLGKWDSVSHMDLIADLAEHLFPAGRIDDDDMSVLLQQIAVGVHLL